ncbi:MAG: carboxypeptidase regulatory-like domain-containing protein [Polyangiaceae bacterium]
MTKIRLAPVVAAVVVAGCSSSPSPLRASADGGAGGGEEDATLIDGSGESSDDASSADGTILEASAIESGGDDGGDSGFDAGSLPPLTITAAASVGALYGTVTDAVTNAGLSGATLTIGGGTSASTDTNGNFQVAGVPTGRTVLQVTAPGHVAWSRQIGVTATPHAFAVHLMPAGATQTVSAADGGMVTAGPATLTFPAGAFAVDANVTATWVPTTQVNALSGRAQFRDSSLNVHRLVGALDVQLSGSEPTEPVTLSVPVPTGLASASLYTFDGDAGEWANPVAATSVHGGMATFTVAHLSDLGCTDDAPGAGSVVTDVGGECTETDPSGGSRAAQVGDLLPLGSQTNTSAGWMSTEDGDGNAVTQYNSDTITWDQAADGTPQCSCAGLCNLTGIDDPSAARPSYPSGKRFLIHTKTAVAGNRGTIYSLSYDPCPSGPVALYDLDVSEGDVNVVAETSQDVTAGEDADSCSGGCGNTAHPSCNTCGPATCHGCCDTRNVCQPGTDDSACGVGGGTCNNCTASFSACSNPIPCGSITSSPGACGCPP